MVFEGYLALGGKEIVNSARTAAYVQNLAAPMAPADCHDCDEGLIEAIGDEAYTTPEQDNAPWYDSTDPETAGFYGFYPMAFEGASTSTRTLELVSEIGDGDVVLGSRHGGRDIMVRGWAFADDKCSLEAGLSWLDNALRGSDECFGEEATLFSCCPALLDPEIDYSVPLDQSTEANPDARWNTTSGTVSNVSGDVVIDWDDDDPCQIAWTEITGMAPGEQYQLRTLLESMDYHVRIGPEAPTSCRANLTADPKALDWRVTSAPTTDADNAFVSTNSGGPLGTGYRQAIYTQDSASPYLRFRSHTPYIPVIQGRRYIISGYVSPAFDGQGVAMGAVLRDDDGVVVTTLQTGSLPVGEGWTRRAAVIDVPISAAATMEVFFRFDTPAVIPANSRIAVANILVENTSGTTTVADPWFDGDTDGYRWTGTPDASTSEASVSVQAETIRGLFWPNRPYPFQPTVLDFVANSGSTFLWITPTQLYRIGHPSDPSIVTISDTIVRKVARPGVRAFGTGDDMTPPSDGWTHLAPTNMEVSWIPEGPGESDQVISRASASLVGAATYSGGHGLTRSVFGLRPGGRYRLTVETSFSYETTPVPIEVGISSGAAAEVETFHTADGGIEYFAVEFTAQDNSVTFSLTPDDASAPIEVAEGESVAWTVFEYMVEELLETDVSDPEVGALERRTLYDVKASRGPTPVSMHKTSCGVMAEVTFGIHAGNPYFFRDPQFAGGLPAGASRVVAEESCTADGQQIQVNYAYNPSVEVDLTGWSVSGTGTSITRVASGSTQAGGFYAWAQAPDSPGNRLDSVSLNWTAPVTGILPFEGQVLTITFGAFAIDANSVGTYDVQYNISTDGGAESAENTIDLVTGFWEILWQHITVPPGEIQSISVTITPRAGLVQGGSIGIDGWGILPGPTVPSRNAQGVLTSIGWDDTSPGAEWTGTVSNSALRYTPPPASSAAFDPDCPPVPEPPAPPAITNSCVDDAAAWNRTTFTISAEEVPRELSAFPIMTLTTGSVAVRQARIRFWPNPTDAPFDQLEACGYEGDIVVSYIPANSTLVIDGVLRTATLTLPTGQEQVATHLLYASDGGPAVWPEISGGVPYYVTLDTDTTQDFSEVLLTVELVVRD